MPTSPTQPKQKMEREFPFTDRKEFSPEQFSFEREEQTAEGQPPLFDEGPPRVLPPKEPEPPFAEKMDKFERASLDFIWQFGGTTAVLFTWDLREIKRNFFQPHKSVGQGFFRAASVVTAPIAFTLSTIEFVLTGIFMAFKSLVDLIRGDKKAAKASFTNCIFSLYVAGLSILGAMISSVVNLVDLIGSLCAKSGKSGPRVISARDSSERPYGRDLQDRSFEMEPRYRSSEEKLAERMYPGEDEPPAFTPY